MNLNESKKISKKKAVLKSLKKGSFMAAACKAADVNVVTVWMWRKEDKKFDKEIWAIIDSRTQVVEDYLYTTAKRNVQAQIFWLKNRGKGKWKDKHEQDFGNVKVNFELVGPKKDDKKEPEKDK